MRITILLLPLLAALTAGGCDESSKGASPTEAVAPTRAADSTPPAAAAAPTAVQAEPPSVDDKAEAYPAEGTRLLPLTDAHDAGAVQNPRRLLHFAEEFGVLLNEIRAMRRALADRRKAEWNGVSR